MSSPTQMIPSCNHYPLLWLKPGIIFDSSVSFLDSAYIPNLTGIMANVQHVLAPASDPNSLPLN